MSVISCELDWHGASGTTRSGGRSYEAHYKVTTDDALDQTRVIVLYFENTSGKPFIGDSYSYGNDADDDAKCVSIAPNRDLLSPFVWRVTVSFETPTDEAPTDENGNPTSNPLDWQGEYSINDVTVVVPVERAYYLGAVQDGAVVVIDHPLLVVNADGPVVAANGIPFDPPLAGEHVRRVFRISQVLAEYPTDLADAVFNTVNSAEYTLPIPAAVGNGQICAVHTSRVTAFGGSLFFHQDDFYWRVAIEIVYDSATWVDEILNRGTHARIGVGLVKGLPSQSTSLWSTAEVDAIEDAGMPLSHAIIDTFGHAVDRPVLLDRFGQPAARDAKPIYLRFLKYQATQHNIIFQPAAGPFRG